MHAIHYTIRRIAAADLPPVLDETGAARAASDQDLLNLGLHRINGDLFSCVEQYRGEHSLALEPHGYISTGELIAHGHDRYANLPDDVKPHVLHAHITRDGVTMRVPMSQVTPSDTVHVDSLEPHRWAGERLPFIPQSTP